MKPNLKNFWASRGVKIDDLKKITRYNNESSKNILKIWDYKKEKLTVKQARKIISEFYPIPSIRTRKKIRGYYCPDFQEGGEKYLNLYIEKQRQREQNIREYNELQKIALTPKEWLSAPPPKWSKPDVALQLSDDKMLVTSYYEDVVWGKSSRKTGYPETKKIYYISKILTSNGSEIKKVRHYCRGDWKTKISVDLGIATPNKPNFLTLSPLCRIINQHKIGDIFDDLTKCYASINPKIQIVAIDNFFLRFYLAFSTSPSNYSAGYFVSPIKCFYTEILFDNLEKSFYCCINCPCIS